MKRPAIILICLLLQACSATTKGLGNSLWDSIFGTPGVHLTDDELQNMPYASQYMQLNDGPQLFVVLAFDENGQQKWVTQDQATIVTQHSRIVKTLLGGDNLLEVNNLAADPLSKPNQITDGASWTRTMGWTEHKQVRYATARSTFRWDGTDSVRVGSDETRVRDWMKRSRPIGQPGITVSGWMMKGRSASPCNIWVPDSSRLKPR